MNTLRKALSVFLIAALGGATSVTVYKQLEEKQTAKSTLENKPTFQKVNFPVSATGAVLDFVSASERTVPAVVHVKTTYERQGYGGNFFDPFNMWGQRMQPQEQQSTGSGVILSEDGYIVTNNHVVDNANKVEVTLDDKRTYTAKVIGTDPATDLALVKVEAKNLPYMPYGNSDDVRVGQWALAVGNPFNLTSTVTAGIVSAKGRNIHILADQASSIESFIQTDAAVNPGNSGGALVDVDGNLIGINSAIASNTGSYSGYSFAIPVNLVKKVVDDLMSYGKVQRGFIGVSIRDIDQTFADERKIKTLGGVYVNGVTEGGAAQNAGLREGDVITRVGNAAVKTSSELQEQVGRYRPGDKVNVTVIRNGEEKAFAVTLRNLQGGTDITKNEVVNMLGADFSAVPDDEKGQLGISSGVKISKLDNGKLRGAGIKEGFIITSIDNKKVNSPSEVANILEKKQGGVLIEGVYPNGMRAYYGFGM